MTSSIREMVEALVSTINSLVDVWETDKFETERTISALEREIEYLKDDVRELKRGF